MLSLTSLAGWEDAVLASIAGARGDIDERDRQVERSGVYGEYPAIVRAYEELFADAECAGEAIKRATFLVWRGAVGLPADTGIAPLPDGTVRAVVDALDARVRRDAVDDEQLWMLAWYHASSPDLFALYSATTDLIDVGVYHVITAAALILIPVTRGRLRWGYIAGMAALIVAQFVHTHFVIKADDYAHLNPVNTTYTALYALWIVGAGLITLFRNRGQEGGPLTKLMAYFGILVWVLGAAAGRWIAFQ